MLHYITYHIVTAAEARAALMAALAADGLALALATEEQQGDKEQMMIYNKSCNVIHTLSSIVLASVILYYIIAAYK